MTGYIIYSINLNNCFLLIIVIGECIILDTKLVLYFFDESKIQEPRYMLQVHHSSFCMVQVSLPSSLWWYKVNVKPLLPVCLKWKFLAHLITYINNFITFMIRKCLTFFLINWSNTVGDKLNNRNKNINT